MTAWYAMDLVRERVQDRPGLRGRLEALVRAESVAEMLAACVFRPKLITDSGPS